MLSYKRFNAMIKWTFLHPLAKPEVSYHLALRLQSVLLSFAWVTCIIGLAWGLYFAPADYQQGDAFRYLCHVPAAVISRCVFTLGLLWNCDSHLANPLRTNDPCYCASWCGLYAIALLTGSIWGKPMWGTWWVWDARLTSGLFYCFCLLE